MEYLSQAAAYTYWYWTLFQFKGDSDRAKEPPQRPASVSAKLTNGPDGWAGVRKETGRHHASALM